VFVPDSIRKCVCFLAYDTGKSRKLVGTGFFVSIPADDPNKIHTYLVTAKHIAKGIENRIGDKSVYIRLNTPDGKYDWIAVDEGIWTYHDDGFVDVAVLYMPGSMLKEFEHLVFPLNEMATPEIFKKERIGLGSEVATIGLFSNQSGRRRNIPIVRVGSIAAVPEEKIRTKMWSYNVEIEAFLVEARSIGGLSGSPVFVILEQMQLSKDGAGYGHVQRLYLLGLVHGHWDAEFSQSEVAASTKSEREAFNMGIAMIIPAHQINNVVEKHFQILMEANRAR
jgi:hypothetical protein